METLYFKWNGQDPYPHICGLRMGKKIIIIIKISKYYTAKF